MSVFKITTFSAQVRPDLNEEYMQKHKSKIGASAMEMILYAAVIIMIAAVAASAFGGINKFLTKNEFVQDVSTIIKSTQAAFSAQGNFSGLNNDVAVKIGAVPADWGAGSSIKNKWGGSVTIAPINSNSQVRLSTDQVPDFACRALVEATNISVVEMKVNSKDVNLTGDLVSALATAIKADNSVEIVFGR